MYSVLLNVVNAAGEKRDRVISVNAVKCGCCRFEGFMEELITTSGPILAHDSHPSTR